MKKMIKKGGVNSDTSDWGIYILCEKEKKRNGTRDKSNFMRGEGLDARLVHVSIRLSSCGGCCTPISICL